MVPQASTSKPPPSVTLTFDLISGGEDDATVLNPFLTYGGELTLRADTMKGNLYRQQYQALGNVRVHDIDTTLTAHTLDYDGIKDHGVASEAFLNRKPFTVRAPVMDLTPDAITAYRARVTTAPPDTTPDLEARVGDLTLHPLQHNGIMHHATLYLFRKPIITVRRISFNTSGGSTSQRQSAVLPAVGVSSRYGVYFVYGSALAHPFPLLYRIVLPTRQPPQIRLTSQQSLLAAPKKEGPPDPALLTKQHDYLGALRQFAKDPASPLPEGDPLLFHGYLPEPDDIRPFAMAPLTRLFATEEVSTHEEASGRKLDNLYVYRLPEVALNGVLPLLPVPTRPVAGDPVAFRDYLRRFVPFAYASTGYGYYEEQPNHLHAARQQDVVGLSTKPLLIGPNTLFLPRIQYTANYYSGQRESYRYLQGSVEINRYFTSYSAVSVQYQAASTTGDSPFNFDVLDTSQELKIRVQMGNRRLAVASQVRFDLTTGGVYDYKIAIAPGLNGITPVFSYNFRNRSVGLGIDIPGLAF
jgi:hypothetical protein